MAPKYLSEAVLNQLRRIQRTHGAQKPILTKSGINKKTFHLMIENGYARADKVDAVLRALDMQETTADQIVGLTCAEFGVSEDEMINASRKSTSGDCKMVAALLLRESKKLSYAQIAARTGYRDHTGVIGALKRLDDALATEAPLRRRVNDLRSKIFSK